MPRSIIPPRRGRFQIKIVRIIKGIAWTKCWIPENSPPSISPIPKIKSNKSGINKKINPAVFNFWVKIILKIIWLIDNPVDKVVAREIENY
jgi:hypothetical protein